MTAYYFVRPMSNEIFDKVFDKLSVVGVGWSKVDFASLPDPQAAGEDVCKVYCQNQGYDPRIIGRWRNTAERFKSIKEGDVILVPRPSAIAIAEALSEELYDPALGAAYDTANLRKVKYKRDDKGDILLIPRTSLSNGLQSRLRMPGSIVVDLGGFGAQIDYLFKYNENAYEQAFNELIIKRTEKAHEDLLRNIQNGKTQLKGGGQGFEELIAALFKALGYSVRILPKTKFGPGADADIEAVFDDPVFGQRSALIQAKHNTGVSGGAGVQQLIKALQDPDYTGYAGVLVTSADNVDAAAALLAAQNNIAILKGGDVVSLIFGNFEKLKESSPDIVTALGMFSATQLFYY